MLNRQNEKKYDWSVKMSWRGRGFFKHLRVVVLISPFTYSWGATDVLVCETSISTKTHWDNDKLAHAHDCADGGTQMHSPVPPLESTARGDGPRASSGPRRSAVWQICLTLHFLHNSLYYGPKWPAWSPWISMSRVSVWVSSVCFDACRRFCRLKARPGSRKRRILLAEAFMSP